MFLVFDKPRTGEAMGGFLVAVEPKGDRTPEAPSVKDASVVVWSLRRAA